MNTKETVYRDCKIHGATKFMVVAGEGCVARICLKCLEAKSEALPELPPKHA